MLCLHSMGTAEILYNDGSLDIQKKDCIDHEIPICGDILTGEEFYEQADRGSINNYDGMVSYVFIDGYKSNLGLHHKGISQGYFLVDGKTWLKLCQEHEIIVEWLNK